MKNRGGLLKSNTIFQLALVMLAISMSFIAVQASKQNAIDELQYEDEDDSAKLFGDTETELNEMSALDKF